MIVQIAIGSYSDFWKLFLRISCKNLKSAVNAFFRINLDKGIKDRGEAK